MNALVPLPVVLPIAFCGWSVAVGPRLIALQRIASVAMLATVLAVDVILLVQADRNGPLVVHLGDFAPPLGVTLVADRLSALMLTVSGAVTLLVLLYAMGQEGRARGPRAITFFHPAYQVLIAGVSLTFLAGDLVNLYVGFEIMLMASFVLITVASNEARLRAGSTYVIVSLASSLVFLVGIALTYAATGTVNFAQLAIALGDLPIGIRTLSEALLLTVFGVKAAVFPVAAWLPDSYPTAPAPVTAVFAGLLTKVGVYCMIRTETLLFPGNRLSAILMTVACASMLIGILGAVAQTDLKRLLSFTLVSHIGFMLYGLALGSAAGISGAIVYTAHHITVQTTLFLACGLLEQRYGTTELTRLGGAVRSAPLIAVLWFVPAMSLAGIPPLSGFLGKLGLIRAGVEDGGNWAYVAIGFVMVSSLLTLYVVTKVWNLAFWRTAPEPDAAPDPVRAEPPPLGRNATLVLAPPQKAPERAVPRLTTGATVAAVLLGLAYTFLATPLVGVADRGAAELLARTPYIEAVLGS